MFDSTLFEFPISVIPMPIGMNGRGPEMDETKIKYIEYQLWLNELNLDIASCVNREFAEELALRWNKELIKNG